MRSIKRSVLIKLTAAALSSALALLTAEVALRLAVSDDGRVERLMGRPSYYLVPFHVPDKLPESYIQARRLSSL